MAAAHGYSTKHNALTKKHSNERGSLLVNLLEAEVDTISLSAIFDEKKSTFYGAFVNEYKSPNAYLKNIYLVKGFLRDCEFPKANAENGNLSYVLADSTDFSGSTFKNTDITGIRGKQINVTDVDFTHTIVLKTKSADTTLTQESLMKHWDEMDMIGWEQANEKYQLEKSIKITDRDTTYFHTLEPRGN